MFGVRFFFARFCFSSTFVRPDPFLLCCPVRRSALDVRCSAFAFSFQETASPPRSSVPILFFFAATFDVRSWAFNVRRSLFFFKILLLLRVRPSGSGSLLPLRSRKLFRRQFFRSWPIAGSLRPRAERGRHPPRFQILLSAKNRRCIRCRDKSRCDLFAGRNRGLHSASSLRYRPRPAHPSP